MSKLETNTIDTVSGTANLTIGGANNTGTTTIKSNNTAAITIDSSQRVGIKTTTPATELDISSGATTGGTKRYITLTSLNASSSEVAYADVGTTFNQNATGNESGGMDFRCSHNGSLANRYSFGGGAGDIHAWYTGTGTERMRITSDSRVLIGKTSNNLATVGIELTGSNGALVATRSGGQPLFINRLSNDGTLVSFYQDTTEEGSISVSGTTVSYNGFTGTHWSRFTDNSTPNILRGTVLESLDKMCDWYNLEFETTDEEENTSTQKIPYVLADGQSDGDVITYNHEGTDVQATIVKETDIKHVKSKVSDTVDAKNVYGVFSAYDNDGEGYNDFYVASVGSFVVRIKAGETVAKGDLLQSNGDGTAKVQADDAVRSSSFAKVLSTTIIETYEDGSYLVPCSLMC